MMTALYVKLQYTNLVNFPSWVDPYILRLGIKINSNAPLSDTTSSWNAVQVQFALSAASPISSPPIALYTHYPCRASHLPTTFQRQIIQMTNSRQTNIHNALHRKCWLKISSWSYCTTYKSGHQNDVHFVVVEIHTGCQRVQTCRTHYTTLFH